MTLTTKTSSTPLLRFLKLNFPNQMHFSLDNSICPVDNEFVHSYNSTTSRRALAYYNILKNFLVSLMRCISPHDNSVCPPKFRKFWKNQNYPKISLIDIKFYTEKEMVLNKHFTWCLSHLWFTQSILVKRASSRTCL